jgi:hypothetical protein
MSPQHIYYYIGMETILVILAEGFAWILREKIPV